MAEKLTNYEKGVLAIFGCDDAETTVICLEVMAHMSNHDEDREKLLKLIDLIERENHFDYMEEYHLLSYEMECKKNLFVREYQYYGGNREDNAPWRNYLNANQMIASKGKSRLKKGRDAYRMYTMWIPDLDKAYLPQK